MSILAKLDLTATLQEISKTLIRVMRQGITQGKGVDFRPSAPLAESTLKARRRRGISSNTRLKATGALYRDGFSSEVSRLRLGVGLSDSVHPDPRNKKGLSFDQIGAYNQSTVTPKPWNPNWFGVPDKVAQDAVRKLQAEIERQLFVDKPWGTNVTARVSL